MILNEIIKIFKSKEIAPTKQSIKSVKKFVLRRNKFYYSTDFYNIGKATEVIKISEDIQIIYTLFRTNSISVINNFIANGDTLHDMTLKNRYKYYIFRNILKNESSFIDLWDNDNRLKNFYNNEGYYMNLDSEEDFTVFNTFCNLNALAILITNDDYFLKPNWNPEFFRQHNIPIPSEELNYDYESRIDDYYVTKGLYIDALDFWSNLEEDSNAYNFTTSFYNVKLENLSVTEKEINWRSIGFKVVEGILKPEYPKEAYCFFILNNKLINPPIIFEKIKIEDYQKTQREMYKKYVIQSYLDTRFVPAHYYSHEELMNNNKYNFWSDLYISEGLAKSIINEYIDEVNQFSAEKMKKY